MPGSLALSPTRKPVMDYRQARIPRAQLALYPRPSRGGVHSAVELEGHRLRGNPFDSDVEPYAPDTGFGPWYFASSPASGCDQSALARISLTQLFRRYPGSLAIRSSNGDKFSVGAAIPPSSTEAPFVPVEASWSNEHAPSQGRKATRHSTAEDRNAIRFHYEASNDFYRLWPDRSSSCSCACFERSRP